MTTIILTVIGAGYAVGGALDLVAWAAERVSPAN